MIKHHPLLKLFIKYIIPWSLTLFSIYYVTQEIDFSLFFKYLTEADPFYIFLSFVLTSLSYLFRARRWQHLFPASFSTETSRIAASNSNAYGNDIKKQKVAGLSYINSVKVLFMGFLMNNILPARAGELIRAHLGSKVSKQSRTVVLATVASERLADGLTLSIFFVLFSLNLDNLKYSSQLAYVAWLFAGVSTLAIFFIAFRNFFFGLIDTAVAMLKNKYLDFILKKVHLFIDGLTPLYSLRTASKVTCWSLFIWSVELLVFCFVAHAFNQSFSLPLCVLFMVVVNFSSLIPAAPGGIGVIEAVATTVLVSVGLAHEAALSMVFTQHVIQYLVVGIPGAFFFLTWKGKIQEEEDIYEEDYILDKTGT
jgi:glycosyltransferase 2 family protein